MECGLNLNQPVRIAFTGAPGAGKTTTARALQLKATNVKVVNEAATRLLEKYKDDPNQIKRMIEEVKDVQVEDMAPKCTGPEIYDRTIVDSLVYDEHFSNGKAIVPPQFMTEKDRMRTEHGFSEYVLHFLLSENKEDYKQIDEHGRMARSQTYAEAIEVQPKFAKGYRSSGYTVCEIPWMELKKRVDFVYCRIAEIVEAKSRERSLPNFELHRYAVGMNDEGGRLAECVQKTKQIWTNLSVAFDRPFVDGINYDDLRAIKSANEYAIKEEAIDSFNERQVNLAYLNIMSYYIKNAQRLAGKDSVNVIFHSFRENDGLKHCELLETILKVGCPEFMQGKSRITTEKVDNLCEPFRYELPDQKVTLIFTYGKADRDPKESVYTKFKHSKTFASADIILTFSVHVGLKPEWGAGTLVIPNKWTPIDVDQMEIQTSKMYKGGNHLKTSISEIVKNPEEQLLYVERINTLFKSRNKAKQDQVATALQLEDFKKGKFLELGGYIFTPEKAKHHSFTVENVPAIENTIKV